MNEGASVGADWERTMGYRKYEGQREPPEAPKSSPAASSSGWSPFPERAKNRDIFRYFAVKYKNSLGGKK